MDIEDIIGTMISGTLQTRRKHYHGANRFLVGGANPFLNASTLLTVGGLVWGVIETMQQSGAASQPSGTVQPVPGPRSAGPVAAPTGRAVPPPLPPIPGAGQPAAQGPSAGPPAAPGEDLPDGATRLIRLMISASRADGQASDAEKRAILEHARKVGAESLVEDEWLRPTPLASVVGVVADPAQKADLYVLAFAIMRADEGISGAERIYLARLATLLGLDRQATDRLEAEAVAKIEQEGQSITG
jgi:hypothetical protein